MINIDLQAVGNWAEKRNLTYTSYTDLAQKPDVYDLITSEVARVNGSLGQDEQLRGALIRKFLILHKELDPDDGELTRTRKVRRSTVTERYAPLIDALYDPSRTVQHISTEVTFEDGRKGAIEADVEIRDMELFPIGGGAFKEAAE